MSWYGGSHVTPHRSFGWYPKPSATDCALATRFACDTITPRGDDVVPDVYCKSAGRSAFSGGSRQTPAPSTFVETTIHSRCAKSGWSLKDRSPIANFACESIAMAGNCFARSIRPGNAHGTA